MRNKKIIVTLIIIITLIQTIIPLKATAFNEKYEIISVPAKINRQTTENEVYVENEMTGMDLMAGLIIEPTVEFLTFIIDSVMSVFSSIMTKGEFQFVVVEKEDIGKLPDLGDNVGAEFTIDNVEDYESFSGLLDGVEYPCFPYSPEEIFAGNIDLLEINFIAESNDDENWLDIRSVVSQWYKILRMIAIIGLLSVLIYTGIKIILSSNTKDKAKYKEMIVNWFMAVILAFSMHYIMAFILSLLEEITGLLQGVTGVVQVNFGETTFKTNLIGVARFQMEQQNFSAKVGNLIIYTALAVYTFKFTFIYLKRVLMMAFLTVISPIVALTYPIDKMDGEAKGFQMWLKEYIFNALLQPMHYILYYILVSSSLTLAVRNPIYGIVALMFISQAEKLLKRIFGFDKAKAGTVGGVAGAFATGAITSSLISHVRNPLHPFGGGSGRGKLGGGSSGGGSSGNGNNNQGELPRDTIDDTSSIDDLLRIDLRGDATSHDTEVEHSQNQEDAQESQINLPEMQVDYMGEQGEQTVTSLESIGDFFKIYRQEIPETTELSFRDGIPQSMEEILAILAEYEKRGVTHGNIPELSEYSYEDLESILRNRVIANESEFWDSGFLPGDIGYIDGDTRTTSEMMEEVIRLNKLGKSRDAQNLLRKIKARMAQNEYIHSNEGVKALRQEAIGLLERKKDLRNTSQEEETTNTTMQIPNEENSQGIIGNQEQGRFQEPRTIADRYAASQKNRGETRPQNVVSQNNREVTRPQNVVSQNNRDVTRPQNLESNQEQEQEDSAWKKFKKKPVIKGVTHVGKTLVKPIWDTEKDGEYNVTRLAGNILKGAAGVTVGVAAAAVQAGISITDGKYNALEGVATIGAGVAGVSSIAKKSSDLRKELTQDEQSIKQYSQQWFNRDDIINSYNREYPGQGKEMRRRAVNNYVSRGITDVKDQKKAMKYANRIMKERGLDEQEADKIAVATLQYKRNLAQNSNYMVLFDKDKRKKYLDLQSEAYTGAASRDSIRRLHDDLIQNVKDFDEVNQ